MSPFTDPTDEIARAQREIRRLEGHVVDSLSLARFEPTYATFLAQNVSKLSPLIASLIELKTVEVLNESAKGWRWIRQDPVFPDAALLTPSDEQTGAGFEVKAWHALSTELTGRFRESRNLLVGKRVSVAVVAWVLDHIVWGTPRILGVQLIEAQSVAEARDRYYYRPPGNIVIEPGDTATRTANLRQTQVAGYTLQESNRDMIASADSLVRAHGEEAFDPYTSEAEKAISLLINRYQYRLDTNFAKMDRIAHPDIEAFKSRILGADVQGRSVADWTGTFRDLRTGTDERIARATAEVAPLFE